MVFIIDLPYLPENAAGQFDPFIETPFAKSLLDFCKACNMDDFVFKKLMTVDFTPTKGMAFVHSIGGGHTGEAAKYTGLGGLSTAINDLGLAREKEDAEMDVVVSTLGIRRENC